MTTRLISLHDHDDDDPLPPPAPLPVVGPVTNTVAGRPPGGALVFDDASVMVITDTTLVGRDPAGDPQVASGALPGVALTGADMSVSRVHAEIRVHGSDVSVVDRGSTNGTYLRRAGGDATRRLDPLTPTHLGLGDTVTFGGVTARFETLDEPGPS